MQIKLNRGPMKNKRIETPDNSCYQYNIQAPIVNSSFYMGIDSYDPRTQLAYQYRRGTYQKSNETLKDGTVVFEWMGWIE